jgi:sulfoxide reductase heme-binding subunit YedZ
VTGPRLLGLITIALAAMCGVLVLIGSTAYDDAHLVIRWTARTSFVMFALAYVARPACQLWPSSQTKTLLAYRKWLGLGFAVSHLFHLAGIIALASPDPAGFVRSQSPLIIVAVLTFIAVFAMAITSITAVRKRMQHRTWRRLHQFGIHLAWVPFMSTYALAIGSSIAFAIPTLILIVIAYIRFAAWRRGMRRANSG